MTIEQPSTHPATSHAQLPQQADEHAARPANAATASHALFSTHCERASGSLHVLAAGLVGRSDAADVVQQAFIIGLRCFHDFAPGTSFHAWMSAIVRNVARNHARSERRQSNRTKLFSLFAPKAPAPSPAAMHDALGAIDTSILEAIESLEEAERSCFLLRAVRDHTYAEIALMLGIEETTARSHVFRARKRLLAKLPSSLGASL